MFGKTFMENTKNKSVQRKQKCAEKQKVKILIISYLYHPLFHSNFINPTYTAKKCDMKFEFNITSYLPGSFLYSNKEYEENLSKFNSRMDDIQTMLKDEFRCKEAMTGILEWLVEIQEMNHLMAFLFIVKIVKELKEKFFQTISNIYRETQGFKLWSATLDQISEISTTRASQLRVILTDKEPWTVDRILNLSQMMSTSDLFASVLRTWFYRIYLKWRSRHDSSELLTTIHDCQQILQNLDDFFCEDKEKSLLFQIFVIELNEILIEDLDLKSEQRVSLLKDCTVQLKRVVPLISSINPCFGFFYLIHTASILKTISSEGVLFIGPENRLNYLLEGVECLMLFFETSNDSYELVLLVSAYEIFSDLYKQISFIWENFSEKSVNNSKVKMFRSLQSQLYRSYAMVEMIYWKDQTIENERKNSYFPYQVKAYEELRHTYEKGRFMLVGEIFENLEFVWKKSKESFGPTWAYDKSFYDISCGLICICVRSKKRILDQKKYQVFSEWCDKFLERAFTEMKQNLDVYFKRLCNQVYLNSESIDEVYVSISQYMKIYQHLDKDLVKKRMGLFDLTVLKSAMFPIPMKRQSTETEIRSLLSIAHFQYKMGGNLKEAEKTLLLAREEYKKWYEDNSQEDESFESVYGLFNAMLDRAFGDVYFAMSGDIRSDKVELKEELALLKRSLDYHDQAIFRAREYRIIPKKGDDKFRDNIRNLLSQVTPMQVKPLSLTIKEVSSKSDEKLHLDIQTFLEACDIKKKEIEKAIVNLKDTLFVLTSYEKTKNSNEKQKCMEEKKRKRNKKNVIKEKLLPEIAKLTTNGRRGESSFVSNDDMGCTKQLETDGARYDDSSFTLVDYKKTRSLQKIDSTTTNYMSTTCRTNANSEICDSHCNSLATVMSSEFNLETTSSETFSSESTIDDAESEMSSSTDDMKSSISTLTVHTELPTPFPDFWRVFDSSSNSKFNEDIDKFCCNSLKVLEKNWLVFSKLREMFLYRFLSSGLDLVCYGSLQTSLTNMSSDVDVVVINRHIHDLTREDVDYVINWLYSCPFLDINIRTCARSPIGISLVVFSVDDVSIDMSFKTESHNGINRTSLISSELRYRGYIGDLTSQVTKVLKEVLYRKGWNKPHTGGISGYILFYLVLFCTDTYSCTFHSAPMNSATLLQFVLYYYGCVWEDEPLVLLHRVKPVKFVHTQDRNFSSSEDVLWVSDPLQPHRNIASRCTCFREIFTFFGRMFRGLFELVLDEGLQEGDLVDILLRI